MQLTLRKDKDGRAGMVELFRIYKYIEDGSVSLRCAVKVNSDMSLSLQEPSVLRQNEFIPLAQIDEEMGIAKYIRAKKPFYSLLDNRTFVMYAKVAFTLENLVYLPEKSHFRLMYPRRTTDTPDGNLIAFLTEVGSYSPASIEWFSQFAQQFAKYNFDREKFFRSRL